MELKGSDELRSRLAAISEVFGPVAFAWTKDSVGTMRGRVHSPSGRMRRSFEGKATNRAGLVFADYRVIFQDRGTKEHGPTKKKALKWGTGPNTVYAKRVRGVKKRPFIRKSARDALKRTPFASEVIALWNQAGGRVRQRQNRRRYVRTVK